MVRIIDVSGLIAGRVASKIAKLALAGENIIVVNCEKAVMSGSKKVLREKYQRLLEIGDPFHGPKFPRRPDLFFKRIIRGMLPRKTERGRKALKRIKCYIGHPSTIKGETETFEEFSKELLKAGKTISIGELARLIGWKGNGS